MKERPILFSGAMVRAILAGNKTMTRRVVKPQPELFGMAGAYDAWRWVHKKLDAGHCHTTAEWLVKLMEPLCPYGQPGDRLWVRETHAPQADCWAAWHHEMEGNNDGPKPIIHYKADGGDPFIEKWRPSIHMPRWASRITLEITAVRVEKLGDIGEEDAIAEGCFALGDCECTAVVQFRSLREKINGSWTPETWVWVIEFRRVL